MFVPSSRAIAVFVIPPAATTPVTLLVGENGSGKSTVLEALAAATRLPTVGSRSADRDPTLAPQRRLGSAMRLAWKSRTHRGFFLRAEDFFGFAKRMAQLRSEFQKELVEVDERFRDHSKLARMLARGPAAGSIAAIERKYGADLDANSHGESFLKLFRERFVPGGLYLLDEPEAALSPQSQLGFMAMMRDMVDQDSQFLIATHSPILMAIPGASIYDFDGSARARDQLQRDRRGEPDARFPQRPGALSAPSLVLTAARHRSLRPQGRLDY